MLDLRSRTPNGQMRSVIFDRFGEPGEVLEVREMERPIPGPGEIIVRMNARPINPSDLIPVRGAYRHRTRLPGVPGFEGVGVVASVGQGVALAVGRRVLPLRGTGTWQEYVRSPASHAIPVPDSIPDELACQLYINPLTAWLILTKALSLDTGDVLVANAGGSAFAHVMVQFAHRLGIRTILVTGSSARLADVGAYAVVDASAGDLRSEVMALTCGKGAVAALDAVGGQAGAELAHCVASGGSFISYGLLSGEPLALSQQQLRELGLSAGGFWLRHWAEHAAAAEFRAAFDPILSLVSTGHVALPEPAHAHPLDQIREAVQAAERRGRKGKVLLTDQHAAPECGTEAFPAPGSPPRPTG